MKKILFITAESLDNPKRGTPIRIYNFIKQISKSHSMIVSAPGVDSSLQVTQAPYRNGVGALSHYKRIIREENIEVVMTATDIGVILPVILKLLTGVKIAIDLHGLYAQEMYDQGMMSKPKSWLVQKKTNFFLRFYDLIFVVSNKLKSYYDFLGGNITVLYGGVNEDEFYYSEASRPSVFTLGYTGNAKGYQGMEYFLAAASNIKKKNLFPFRLNLIMSSGRGEMENSLKELDLEDITDLHFKVPHTEVNKLISQSHVLVIPRPSLLMTEFAYPSKLPEYLATGIPLIITDVGPVRELLENKDCSVIIKSSNITEELESAIVEFHSFSDEQRVSIGRRAVEFVRHNLTWNTLGSSINQALSDL